MLLVLNQPGSRALNPAGSSLVYHHRRGGVAIPHPHIFPANSHAAHAHCHTTPTTYTIIGRGTCNLGP